MPRGRLIVGWIILIILVLLGTLVYNFNQHKNDRPGVHQYYECDRIKRDKFYKAPDWAKQECESDPGKKIVI